MSAALKRAVTALQTAPPLLNGLSWGALALVLAFCVLSAAEVAIMPGSGAAMGDLADQAAAGLVRVPVFLVTGVTALVTAVIVLNATGRTGRERIWLAVFAAVADASSRR
jgi:hypothetical protein